MNVAFSDADFFRQFFSCDIKFLLYKRHYLFTLLDLLQAAYTVGNGR